MNIKPSLLVTSGLIALVLSSTSQGAVVVTGVKTDGVDAAYSADASNSDLVNDGASSLSSTFVSTVASPFSSTAHNNGTVGAANTNSQITFWAGAAAGTTRSITYTLDLTTNTLGYDINSIQTIHGWTGGAGNQKNQNYEVFVSAVGSATFTSLATVAYLPYVPATTNTASTKVNITESVPGMSLATGIDEIRFTYTIVTGGSQPSPTIREIDVFGIPSVTDATNPTASILSPADGAMDVLPGSNLVLTFNENVTIGSGDITIKNLDAPSQTTIPVADSQVSVSGTVLTINPATDLAPGTNYAIQIAPTAIDDLAGNSFAGITDDITWNFSTAAPDITAPTVTTLSPADGAMDIMVSNNLVVTFNENISIGSGDITIKNLDAPSQIAIPVGDSQISVSGNALTINLIADLSSNTNYAIQIAPTAIDDLAGNSYAGIIDDTTWNFTTSGIVITAAKTDGVDASFGADASNSDLVNSGASSLASTAISATPHFGPTAHNNGSVGTANNTNDITFWLNATVGQTYSITYSLDTAMNTLGYIINSIQTIHGWTGNASGYQKNQNYEVFVSTVGDPGFTSLATVAYNPYTTANNTASTKVNITQGTTGILASGIDEIRFTYTIVGGGTNPSPTIREIDVFGSAVPLGPDLTEPTISNLNPLDNAGAVSPDSNLVVTFNESIAIGSGDITIKNLDAPSQTAIPVGNAQISISGAVLTINPNTNLSPNTNYAIQIAGTAIDDTSGNSFPGITNDTTWNFTTTNLITIPLALTSPVIRQVVQRNGASLGSIPVVGTGAADRVEARAVAVGASGVTTPWQTIATNPNGAFSGSLTAVTAGGWYSIEVRTVTAETTVESATINQVGVGDIYVTAGQSNSANHGSPGLTPTDNRVVARSSASANTWVAAADPMPLATGTGGSTWSRLGDLLAAEENIPIGFIAIGVGSTQVSQWVPGTTNYDSRLKPALQSLPINGFRAVLWHQGESDSIAGVSASTHASRLNSMISQSRTDAGWNMPWYLAEASFHPNTSLVAEERIAAGQRAVVNSYPLTFLGPSTDEFHLEDAAGGKLTDSVHFNAAGLLDHATQWRDILRGTTVITPRNSGFEDNRTLAITNLSALADGASHIVTISGDNDSPMVLDWRILAASGVEAADGNNGFHNPTAGTYAGAVDTVNSGVLSNMDGRHVAMLDGGSAGNTFLQSTRVAAKPNTNYTLTVALGVRDNPAAFGNARLEITANGTVVASATFNKAALDTLRGSDTTGTFTNASVSWTTSGTVAANQLLAIRVIKTGGAATVLDFDNIRFTELPNIYTSWINGFNLNPADKDFNDDPDGDGLANGLEAWFGTNPGQFNAGIASLATTGSITTFTHPMNINPVTDISGFYQWSQNLITWYPSGGGPSGGPTVTFAPVTVGATTSVTATANAPLEKLFLRVRATQN